jgi:hypothetical protein
MIIGRHVGREPIGSQRRHVPVSPGERDELAARLQATGQPAGAVAGLTVSQPEVDTLAPP